MFEHVHSHASAALQRPPRASLSATRFVRSPFLSDEERQRLEQAPVILRSVGAGIDLVRQQEPGDLLIFVVEGWACRYKTTPNGGRQISALLVAGDLGNIDALMFDCLDFGIRTLTPTTILTISRERAIALTADYTGIARAVTWFAMVENAVLSQWMLCLGRQSAATRLAHLFCELSTRLRAEDGNKSSFQFPLTQEHLADVLGLTPIHVNRTMQYLRGEGLIRTEHRRMILPDLERLRRIGEFDPHYLHAHPKEIGRARPTLV